ncbi:radical SAM protein [Planctomycetota bacterium]
MAPVLYGVCETCRERIPARHVIRDGKVFISKDCPDCGATEALVSSDAATWERKREIWHYKPDESFTCKIDCPDCGHHHAHRMLFLDVTNRCNMNCPICINNTPAMGFVFDPPLEYFDHVLAGLAEMAPKPTVQLFGGEPTVRKDLFEIIGLCRKHGLRVRIVTNGIKLADEAYCKRICDAKVPVLLGCDGLGPEIYEKLRKNPGAGEKKMQALENLAKLSDRKNTVMVCCARRINEDQIRPLIDFIHDRRHAFDAMHLIPLTETWEEGEFEHDIATTTEDVEQIVDDAFPDERVEFLPAGIAHQFRHVLRFFGDARLTFGGVHPNCESLTLLCSDGERYHALSRYMRRPLDQVAEEAVGIAERIAPKLLRLDPGKWLQRWRGRLAVFRAFGGLVRRSTNWRNIFRGNSVLAVLKILFGLAVGRKGKVVFRKHTQIQDALRMIVLPFEEYHAIDGARLVNCTAGFAFEDADTGEVRTMPVCSFSMYKTEIQRKIAEKYAKEPATT